MDSLVSAYCDTLKQQIRFWLEDGDQVTPLLDYCVGVTTEVAFSDTPQHSDAFGADVINMAAQFTLAQPTGETDVYGMDKVIVVPSEDELDSKEPSDIFDNAVRTADKVVRRCIDTCIEMIEEEQDSDENTNA